jgi:hypothetical protein
MGGHTLRPKYENSCVLSNADGECRMCVTVTDRVNERRGAGGGYGATGRPPGVQWMLTKVSNRRRLPAMPPLSRHLQAGRCVSIWALAPAPGPPPGSRRRWVKGYLRG